MFFRSRHLLVAAAAGGFLLACGAGGGEARPPAAETRQQPVAKPETGGNSTAAGAPAANTRAASKTPRPAPDFSINLPDGSKLPVEQFRGKIVPLIFIGTTCPHCQEVTRDLNEIQREYGPKGVQILMAAMDEKAPALVPAYIQRFQPAYPMGWAPHQDALAFMQVSLVAPGYVPKVAFIDRNGVIRSQYGGEEPFFKNAAASFRAELDRLLKEPAGTGKKRRK